MTADGWLRTGDLRVFAAQGRRSLVGHTTERFKTRKGKCVPPAPIEGRQATFTRLEAWARLCQPVVWHQPS